MRRFLRWMPPLVLLLCGGLSLAVADDNDFKNLHPNAGQGITQPGQGNAAPSTDAGDKPEKPAPVFAYFMAVVVTIVVLCILCVPSRKAESATTTRR
ncbi:MAG TPA: hypothetical protein VMS17_10495 [Gemmataceae bacterium]|nr:hypothetical protein [Gemmataceae bacterium]